MFDFILGTRENLNVSDDGKQDKVRTTAHSPIHKNKNEHICQSFVSIKGTVLSDLMYKALN